MIRDIVPAYLEETFLGLGPVLLGDDAALTLFARGRGKAVQQPTAFALTMYPETLSHHFRQWIRWMRGSTIRNCWRVRYLPLTSWGWWFTVLGVQLFLASVFLPVVAGVSLDDGEDLRASWPSPCPGSSLAPAMSAAMRAAASGGIRAETRKVKVCSACRIAEPMIRPARLAAGGSIRSSRQCSRNCSRTRSGRRSLQQTCSVSQAVSLSASATVHSRNPRNVRIWARWYSNVRPDHSYSPRSAAGTFTWRAT